MTEDYDARREKIEAKKIASGQRDLARICHCGLVRAHHTAAQANKCKKTDRPEVTKVTRMTDRDVSKMEQMKI